LAALYWTVYSGSVNSLKRAMVEPWRPRSQVAAGGRARGEEEEGGGSERVSSRRRREGRARSVDEYGVDDETKSMTSREGEREERKEER